MCPLCPGAPALRGGVQSCSSSCHLCAAARSLPPWHPESGALLPGVLLPCLPGYPTAEALLRWLWQVLGARLSLVRLDVSPWPSGPGAGPPGRAGSPGGDEGASTAGCAVMRNLRTRSVCASPALCRVRSDVIQLKARHRVLSPHHRLKSYPSFLKHKRQSLLFALPRLCKTYSAALTPSCSHTGHFYSHL